jgi:hypothetical protein
MLLTDVFKVGHSIGADLSTVLQQADQLLSPIKDQCTNNQP